ncbi:MAG: serine/threonine protein kinase [Sandaracinaceae bacterium]
MAGERAITLEGRQLGRHRLRHRLADGGMSTIYLAETVGELSFSRWVAIKVIRADAEADEAFVTMLGDEARLLAQIHHPNVCSAIDLGSDGALHYLVMEYLHGQSLAAAARRSWKEDRSFPAWLVARVVADAAFGLHAAHQLTDADGYSMEVVHRDVSPENILISYDGPSKVVDFGIVSGRGRETKTQLGTVKGKLSHMSPEQLLGGEMDRRADVWSLGVVLWECTLGRRLFRAKAPGETIAKVANMTIPRPSEIAPKYPPALEAVVMGALTRDVERRTPDAATLARDLEKYLYSLGPPAGHAQVARWMRRVFSDRLIVREALMQSPQDLGSLEPEPMADEGEASSSQLLSSSTIGSPSFAPPPRTEIGELSSTLPAPAAPDTPSDIDDADESAAENLALRAQLRFRGVLVTLLCVVALALAAVVGYLLNQP